MRWMSIVFAATLALGVAVGCEDKKDETKPNQPAGQSGATVGDAAKEMVKKAEDLLKQAQDAIGSKKWDDAEKAIKSLEAMKDKLPAEWADKIKQVRKALDAAKNAGMSIPALGGGASTRPS